MNATPAKRRRWLRYSLRTIFVLMLALGIAFGFIARHAHNRKAAIAAVRDNGGSIVFESDAKPSWRERLLGRFFGPETYQPVRSVNMLTGGQITIAKKTLPIDFLATLSALSELEFLGLENSVIADADWQYLARFRQLFIMNLGDSNISDAGAKYLAQLPELDTLSMGNTKQITNAALASIARLPKLTNLKLSSTKITDEGLRNLVPLSKLQILEIHSTKVSSAGMDALKPLRSLSILLIYWTEVDDKGLDHLTELPNLERLGLNGTRVTADAARRFKELHPNCTLTGP